MPTIAFTPYYGSLSIKALRDQPSVHLITAIATLAQCSHRLADVSNGDQVGIEIELLMLNEVDTNDKDRLGLGHIEWFSSAEGASSAYGPYTIGVIAYLSDSAFDFCWSRFLANSLTGFRIVIELGNEPSDLYIPWKYKLNHHYPIHGIRIEHMFGADGVA